MDIDRRRALESIVGATLGALGLGAPATAAPADAPTVATGATGATAASSASGFGDLTAALTGYPAPSAADASAMLAAFDAAERRVALMRLARVVRETTSADLDATLRAQGLDRIADELVAAWYSGVVVQGTRPKVVLYANASMWSAMSFTKPMGRCGGVTNYWSAPPV